MSDHTDLTTPAHPELDCAAEARAALAAVQWNSGQHAQAEEQLEAATAVQAGWGRINFVKDHTRWPPKLYAALESMLSFAPM